MNRRFFVGPVAVIMMAGMVGLTPSPAAAKATKKGYCKYVRKHQLEFVVIFGIETSVDQAAPISDKEIAGYLRVAPAAIRGDYKTFRALVQAIASHDSDAMSAAAPPAGAASQRIIAYTQNNCGSSLPPASGSPTPTG
jgi:hypothetical protein